MFWRKGLLATALIVALLSVPIMASGLAIPITDPPPSGVSIPPFEPVPIQAAWNVDITDDEGIDLVQGKPMAILVNASFDPNYVYSSVFIEVEFESVTYSTTKTKAELDSNSVVVFLPIVPSILGDHLITGTYQVDSDTPISLTSVPVTVKDTSDLSLYYAYLYREDKQGNPIDYGYVDSQNFADMVGNSSLFINSTFPISTLLTDDSYKGLEGNKKGNRKDIYAGMRKDALAAAQAAQLAMGGSSIGVAIAPNATGYDDYFAYHLGYSGPVGISFGPSLTGVVVLDGYYTGVAHEDGHTSFALNWGMAEEYQTDPPYGRTCTGVSVAEGEWRSGYNFMGAGPWKTLDENWVCQDTFEDIFMQTRLNPADPRILLPSFEVYRNGTIVQGTWYLSQGTPDTPWYLNGHLPSYAFRFLGPNNDDLIPEVKFSAPFIAYVEPFGEVETNATAVSFATNWPQGTVRVQIVNITDPQQPVVLAEQLASDIIDVITYDVTVVVKDPDGNRISGATVTLNGDTQQTNGNGETVFTVNEDFYTITASKSGYTPATTTEYIDGDTIIELVLTPTQPPEPVGVPEFAAGLSTIMASGAAIILLIRIRLSRGKAEDNYRRRS